MLTLRPEDQARLKQLRERWDRILRDGVIVDLTITQWHPHAALTTDRLAAIGVRAQTDEAAEAAKRILHAGHIDLIPKEFYNVPQRLANAMRQALNSRSFKVMWGRMVPAEAYEAWRAEHDLLQQQFDEAVYQIESRINELVTTQEQQYYTLFGDAWERLSRMGLTVGNKLSFIYAAIDDLRAQVPQNFAERYSVNLSFSYAPMADEIAAAEARAEQIRYQSRLETSTLDEARGLILQRMQGEVEAQLEQRRLQVEDSLANAERAFYSQVSEIADNLKAGLAQRDGKLMGRGAVQVRSLIEQVRTLNIFDSQGLTAQVNKLEQAAASHLAASPKVREETLRQLVVSLDAVGQETQAAISKLPNLRGVRAVMTPEAEAVAQSRTVNRGASQVADLADLIAAPISRRTVQPLTA